MRITRVLPIALAAFAGLVPATRADSPSVRADEARRMAVINKVRPAVVAIYAKGAQGGGSGVLIDKDGYALTNFHVVQGSGPVMQCGLADGILYDAVLVGLDKVGDVALVKLLPKKEGSPFPFAPMGDSDKTQEGDWSLAMGNPFLLATDFTPTVTFGLVSGVHRYQYPEGTLLEYTDCIQIDTSINPGNSGGPLFNMQGELIGINGRGSFDKRRRINSGVGYAISINQIKNFLGHLYAGLDTDHATPGFVVHSGADDTGRLEVKDIQEDADAFRRGITIGDELISFAGRGLSSVNEYKNVLGICPKEWRLPLTYKRQNKRQEVLIRLLGLQTKDPNEEDPTKPKPPPGTPAPPTPPKPPIPDTPAKKLYVEKKGFANFHFNELAQKRLTADYLKHGDFTSLKGEWVIDADMELKQRKTGLRVSIGDEKIDETTVHPLVKFVTDTTKYDLDPLKSNPTKDDLTVPGGSGGLLMALYHYKRFLTEGMKGFAGRNSYYAGHEPFYPYPADGSTPKSLKDLRVDCEVMKTEYAGVISKWYFARTDQKLLGFEVYVEANGDPCEVYLADYKAVDGRQLPHRLEVRYGDDRFAILTVKSYKLAGK
ncbi:MAG: S1C family serine protease [Gemmataceae bacterium]